MSVSSLPRSPRACQEKVSSTAHTRYVIILLSVLFLRKSNTTLIILWITLQH